MKKAAKKWSLFTLRWGIAVVGVWWVVSKITLYDTVYQLNDDKTALVGYRLAEPLPDNFEEAKVIDPKTGGTILVTRDKLFTEPDAKTVDVVPAAGQPPAKPQEWKLLALQLREDQKNAQLFVAKDPNTGKGIILNWFDDPKNHLKIGVKDYHLSAKRSPVQVGVVTMLHQANPLYLWLAVLVFPITFIITSIRWNALLRPLDIVLTQGRTFVLNMVGAFYNSFMPGSTGGDVLKALYASRQTPHKTRAVMSVLIDRIIGLLALVVLGGAMAAVTWAQLPGDNSTGRACLRIAVVSGLIMLASILGLWTFYHPTLKRISGLDWIIRRLPMQKQVHNAIHVMEVYRRRPGLVLWAFIITFPVHAAVAISAMFAGWALQLPISSTYYFVVVPVLVLVGSLPISPQGAGVMEYFAVKLTEREGASVSHAVALTMSIRLVQMFWNLTGGILVLKGGYHAPTDAEREEVQKDRELPDEDETQAVGMRGS